MPCLTDWPPFTVPSRLGLWVIAAVTGSALSHNSLPITATLALLPQLTRPQILQRHGRRKLAPAGLLVIICTAFSLTQPAVMEKLNN